MPEEKGITASANKIGAVANTINKLVQINHPEKAVYPKPLTSRIPLLASLEDVIGREGELAELRDRLLNSSQLMLVNGIGGVGKTCLAQAYVTRFWDDYAHVVWVTQVSDFVTDFVFSDSLLTNLSIDKDAQDTEALYDSAVNALNALDNGHNLLVIDNADERLAQWQTRLPKGHWHILVTSREQVPGFSVKELDFLTPQSAVQLFKTHFSRRHLREEQIAALVKQVDYHTLTIEILARTAHDLRVPYEDLQRALSEDISGKVLQDRDGNKQATPGNIRQYLTSVFAIGSVPDAWRWLLAQFVFLPSEFHSYAQLKALVKPGSGDYADSFEETLDSLKQRGWLMENTGTDSYKMHAVIAESLHPQLNIRPDDITPLMDRVTGLLEIDQSKDNPVDKFPWVPFGKRLCEKCQYIAVEREPASLSTLQNNLATVLQDLGDYEGARELLEKALASDEANFGEAHPNTARCYSNLGNVLRELGDYEGARELLVKALASDEANFGETHPSTAIRYSNLAMLLKALGDYEGARGLLEKALASDETNFGDTHPTTAIDYSNLGLVLQDLGDYEGARGLLEKSLASDETNFGNAHPTTATGYSNLGNVLKDLGDYEGARKLLEKALASNEANFGDTHPTTAISYSSLGLVLQALGDYECTRELLEKALASDEANFGEAHPNTAISYSNLATVLRDLGDYEGARALFLKAKGIFIAVYPAEHPYIAKIEQHINALPGR